MKMKRLLSLFVLLVAIVTGAHAYYTPTENEVIILKDVYSSTATDAGYSTHAAIAWEGTASTNSKKAGDPNNNGEKSKENLPCFSVKGNGKGKNITVSVSGVQKIIIYHEEHSSRYIELLSGGKDGELIGKGALSTTFTEVELDASTDYSIFLHGTAGTDDQDFYIYAIKLIKTEEEKISYQVQGNNVEYLLTESNYNADDFFTQGEENRWTPNKGDGDYNNGEKYYNMANTSQYLKLNVKGARDFKFVVEGTKGRHYAVQINKEEPVIVEHPEMKKVNDTWVSYAESQIFATPSVEDVVTIKISGYDGGANSVYPLSIIFNSATKPIINTEVQDAEYTIGSSDYPSFSVNATASAGTLSYLWYYYNGNSMISFNSVTGATLSQATMSTLEFNTFKSLVLDAAGDHIISCRVTDSNGSVVSSGTLTVYEGSTEPTITTQPEDVNYMLGSVTYPEMSVVAEPSSAGGALSYKWFANFGASDVDLSLILGEAATSSTISFEDVKDYVPSQYMQAGFSFTMYCQVTEAGVATPVNSETATVTIIDPYAQADVTEAATWDWSKYGTTEIKLTAATTPAKGEDFLLSSISNFGYDAPVADFGNAQQLILNTEYVVRSGSFMQGNSVKFNTTVGGTVKVYYSNTGGSRPYRHIWVNGTLSAEGSASTTMTETEEIPVAAGEVEIKAYIPDATNPEEKVGDVEGFAPIRIYKIEFTPLTQLVITTQPSDVTYAMGTTDYPTATVEAIASAGELTYEWRYRSSQYAFYPLPESNSPTLDFADYTTGVIGGKLEEEGSYVFYCAVTDDNGTSYSEDFTLTVAEGVASVTLNSMGYATFSCAEKVEVATQGVTVYYASGFDIDKENNKCSLIISPKPTGNIVTWDEGVILVGKPGTVVNFAKSDGNGDPAPGNLLRPTTTANEDPVYVPSSSPVGFESDAMTLDGSTFKWFKGEQFKSNRAYLLRSEIVDAMAAANANSLEIAFDKGNATAVDPVAEAAPVKAAPIKVIKDGKLFIGNYNVAGQLVK